MNIKRVLLFSLVILSINNQALHSAPTNIVKFTLDSTTVESIQKETGLEEKKKRATKIAQEISV